MLKIERWKNQNNYWDKSPGWCALCKTTHILTFDHTARFCSAWAPFRKEVKEAWNDLLPDIPFYDDAYFGWIRKGTSAHMQRTGGERGRLVIVKFLKKWGKTLKKTRPGIYKEEAHKEKQKVAQLRQEIPMYDSGMVGDGLPEIKRFAGDLGQFKACLLRKSWKDRLSTLKPQPKSCVICGKEGPTQTTTCNACCRSVHLLCAGLTEKEAIAQDSSFLCAFCSDECRCTMCSRTVIIDAIECDDCKKWTHFGCAAIRGKPPDCFLCANCLCA